MIFYVMTLFPEMIESISNVSILKRGKEAGHIDIRPVNIRDYAGNKHGSVDDYPYGGGAGMLMQAAPVYDCYRAICDEYKKSLPVIYLTPQGETFKQDTARSLANYEALVLLCGHYEGIDERVIEKLNPIEVSMGDYVLTGGELPAMVIIDAVARLVPGVLHNDDSTESESFSEGLLEYPQYTRPAVWEGMEVPEILLSGDHAKVDAWRREQAILRTKSRRPDLLKGEDA